MTGAASRPRRVRAAPFPPSRRLVLGALRAGRQAAPMHGLVELDVTEARRRCRAADLSFTAYVVACAARAAAEHPAVHAYRDWRGRLITHDHVDVGTLIEIAGPDGPFAIAHLVRDADVRSAADISRELRAVRADPAASRSGQLLRGVGPVAFRVPGFARGFSWALARSVRMRRLAGTVSVTSVGMFGGGSGFGISFATPITLTLVVGGVSERPRAVAGAVEIRDVLDLTITIDHTVVDGAPAARFTADLRRLIESAELLD
jgi:pyruvate/2-oxoglutarate dehydrogenase complex dihydrolipoamide acyltransferase (E2) component